MQKVAIAMERAQVEIGAYGERAPDLELSADSSAGHRP